MQRFFSFIRFLAFALLLWGVIAMGSCAPARTILQQADLSPEPAAPARLDNIDESFARLQASLYGPFVEPTQFELIERDVVASGWLNGKATVERRIYTVSHGQTAQNLDIIFVTPNADLNAPLIISQNFSSNNGVIAVDGKTPLPGGNRSMGVFGPVFRYFFGRYISEPPLEEIIDRGYAFAAMHPPDYVADRQEAGVVQLNAMFGAGDSRPGALNVWASLTTTLAAQVKAETPDRPVLAYGHSRYGKTALLAAAYSDDVDAAIAHQTGTAGASLMRDKTGESIKDVMNMYPQWLTPAAAEYADNPRSLPSDAHGLLAKIAPKPIFLGNARRDVWSDPEGAFRAAKWAAGNSAQSFTATRLDDFQPADDIAFWTRPGTHGVTKEDWPAFLAFADAHFKE